MGRKKKPDWLRAAEKAEARKALRALPKHRRSRSVPIKVKGRSDVCEICGVRAVPFISHHIIPLGKGGEDSVINCILLCQACENIAHGKAECPDSIPIQILRFAAQYGSIGGMPRNTILNAVAGTRQQLAADLSLDEGKESA